MQPLKEAPNVHLRKNESAVVVDDFPVCLLDCSLAQIFIESPQHFNSLSSSKKEDPRFSGIRLWQKNPLEIREMPCTYGQGLDSDSSIAPPLPDCQHL